MKKPVIVTNIDNLLIDHKVFVEPHKAWFDRAIKKTGDKSLGKWKGRKDYFLGVNIAMDMIMPKATKKQKTSQAREWYQADVVKYIKDHPRCVKRGLARKLESLSEDFTIVLLTTNTQEYIDKILRSAGLTRVYDGIVASRASEEPDKMKLIKRLVREYGPPKYYTSGKEDPEVYVQFRKLGTKILTPSGLERL